MKQCKPRYRDEQDREQQVLNSLVCIRCGVGRGVTLDKVNFLNLNARLMSLTSTP